MHGMHDQGRPDELEPDDHTGQDRARTATSAGREILHDSVVACLDGHLPVRAEHEAVGEDGVDEFVRHCLFADDRRLPIVGVSMTRFGASIVDLAVICEKLAGVAHIRTFDFEATWALSGALPEDRLGVWNGAVRIWWPGVKEGCNPFAHPLWTWERRADAERQLLQSLLDTSRARFVAIDEIADLRRRRERAESEALLAQVDRLAHAADVPDLRDTLDRLTRRVATLERANAEINEVAAQAELDREAAVTSKLKLEQEVARLQAMAEASERGLSDPTSSRGQFEHAIWEAVAELVRGDAGLQPRNFVLGRAFLESVRALEGVASEKIIKVCAEVVTGLAGKLGGRKLHALRVNESGGSPQRVRRSDGATAWRCAVHFGKHSAPRLHWWVLPQEGKIEFANVGVHDDESCPE